MLIGRLGSCRILMESVTVSAPRSEKSKSMPTWSTAAVGLIAIGATATPDRPSEPGGHDSSVIGTLVRLGRGPAAGPGSPAHRCRSAASGNQADAAPHWDRLAPAAARGRPDGDTISADVPRLIGQLEAETQTLLGLVSSHKGPPGP